MSANPVVQDTLHLASGEHSKPPATPPPSAQGMTRPARIAATIMATATIILVASVVAVRLVHEPRWLLIVMTVIRHASEGALVGGICDFIAVKAVYSKARTNFRPLVRGVSETVVKDFVGVRKQLASATLMQAKLFSDENLRTVREWLRAALPPKRVLREHAYRLWDDSIRVRTARWLATVDVQAELLGANSGGEVGALNAPEVRETVARCLDVIAKDRELAEDMVESLRTLADGTTLTDLGIPTEPDALTKLLEEVWRGAPRKKLIGWLIEIDLRAERNTQPRPV